MGEKRFLHFEFSQCWKLVQSFHSHEKLYVKQECLHKKFESEKTFWPVFIQEKVFFHSFLPLTTGFPSKNRMLLTHHQHDFENFWKHFSWLYSNVNTPYKRQVWPRPRRAKVALLTYIFTFCNFLWEPNNMAKFSHNWMDPKNLQHKIQTSNFCTVTTRHAK